MSMQQWVQKLAARCRHIGFVNSVGNSMSGPHGSLLRRNIQDQWYKQVVREQDSVFLMTSSDDLWRQYLPNLDLFRSSEEVSNGQSCLLNLCTLNSLTTVRKKMTNQLPLGVATLQKSLLTSSKDSKNPDLGSAILTDEEGEQLVMCLHYLVPPGEVEQWLDVWHRHRLHWWKGLSMDGAVFTTEEKEGCITVQYEAPWGHQPVETLQTLGPEALQTLGDSCEVDVTFSDGRKDVVPHVIECSTSVEIAAAAFLSCALVDTSVSGGKPSLRNTPDLHPSLTPYKVAILLPPSERLWELREVGSYISRELRTGGLDVLYNPAASPSTPGKLVPVMASQGVLMACILSEDCLQDGILEVVHRNTGVHERLHITQVKDRVLRELVPV